MKIKRTFAPTMREALSLVKQEQGADAVILGNKKYPVASKLFRRSITMNRLLIVRKRITHRLIFLSYTLLPVN